MKYFMAHFRLNDEGEFELEGDGEDTEKDASLAKRGRTKKKRSSLKRSWAET
jgi:hypothetical protein